MAGREIQVRLFRDALSTPWGFRLAGGKDLHTPLFVQRVAVGSPVDGELHRGDIILEIQNQNASNMTHKQAQEAIRNAGGSLTLRVKRPLGQYQAEAPTHAATPATYLPSHRGFMLNRLQETLSNVVGYPASSGYGSDYGDYSYNSPTSPPPSSYDGGVNNYPTWTRSAPRQRPPTITPLMEPGWTPQCLVNKPQHGRRPQTAAAPQQVRVVSMARAGGPRAYGAAEEAEAPAWLGSLRPSVESKPSDQRAAGLQNSGDNGYQPRSANQTSGTSVIALPEGAQHLQYNSPLALYNRSNVQQVVASHFGGVQAGAETANGSVKSESDVYRLVHEGDRRKTAAVSKTSAGLDVPHTVNADSIRQSPSIRLLESRLLHGQDHNDATAVGETDF